MMGKQLALYTLLFQYTLFSFVSRQFHITSVYRLIWPVEVIYFVSVDVKYSYYHTKEILKASNDLGSFKCDVKHRSDKTRLFALLTCNTTSDEA